MKNIKLNSFTIYFLFVAFLCGYIKNGLIILSVVLIHELGHVFFIKLFGYKIKSITIYPFGGVTKVEKNINTPINKELLIALGGIIFQLVIFLIPVDNIYTKNLINSYNMTILLFNLLPIIPLDGSIIINLLLNKFLSFKRSYLFSFIISICFFGIFISYNMVYSLNNYLVCVFLLTKTICYIKDKNMIYNKFLLERFLQRLKYKSIKTSKGDLRDLKLDTYHYFYDRGKVISEKKLLDHRFDKYS